MNPDKCPDCGHLYTHHTSEGCCHHDLGVICGCMVLPTQQNQEARTTSMSWDEFVNRLQARNVKLGIENLKLEEKLRVQTARADRLDKENDDRFTRETEYQNRIRALENRVQFLEQKLRDVASYAARYLP